MQSGGDDHERTVPTGLRERWSRIPLWARRLPVWVGLTLLLFQPTPHRVSRMVFGDLGDSMFLTWTLSWGARGLRTDPTSVFDAPIFHPEPQALAFSDPMLSVAPVFGVIEWISGSSIVALNLTMLGLFVFALAAAHALAMRVFGRADVALVVAVVICCNGFVFGQQNHPQLQTFGFLSLGFLALLRAIEHRRIRDGVGLGLVVVAMSLANLLYGLIWIWAAIVVVATLFILRTLPPLRSLLPAGISAVAVTGVIMGPVALVYLDVDERNGLARGYEPWNSLFRTDLLTPHRGNWSWGTRLDGVNSLGFQGEHWMFLGFSVMALAVVGAVMLARLAWRRASTTSTGVRVDEAVALIAAGVFAGVLALGPSPSGFRGPFRIFHRLVPGFDGIRVPSRFAVISFIAVALLVGLAYQFIADRYAGRWHRFAAPLLVAVIVLEVGGVPGRVTVPEGDRLIAYELLDGQPDGVVLELPMESPASPGPWAFVEAPRMYHALTDGNVRINGYSGAIPSGFEAFVSTFNEWPIGQAEPLADDLDVRYVILHGGIEQGTPAYTEEELAVLADEARALGHEVIPAGEDLLIIRSGS